MNEEQLRAIVRALVARIESLEARSSVLESRVHLLEARTNFTVSQVFSKDSNNV